MSAPRTVTVSRVFDAPRALVFRAWTDPGEMAQWFGPHHFTIPVCELDVRVGGALKLTMKGPDGGLYPMTGTFEAIAANEAIVMRTQAYLAPDMPASMEVLQTVTFEDVEGKTRVTVRNEVVWSTPAFEGALAGMEAGWEQSFDKLARLVE